MYYKLFQSGDLVEVYAYERSPSPKRLHRVSKTRRELSFQRPRRLRRADNLNKAKQSFRRLVRANLSKGNPCLLTLTMHDILDYNASVREFQKFGQRFRAFYGSGISWIAVPEFQRRGALHYHALVWGLSHDDISTERSTRRIADIWGRGFVDLIPTDGSPKLATYLSKYMSKAMSDARLVGKRAYYYTRNILRTVSINTPHAFDSAVEALGLGDIQPLQDRNYDTMWLGRANYKSWSLHQHGTESSKIDS